MAQQRVRSSYLKFHQSELGTADIVAMFREMAEWLAVQQVQDPAHPHHGAVWFPTETRYDNRDTGCAALAYRRLHQMTGDDRYAAQAELARDYALRVQEEDGGYAELTRGNERMDEGSIVNTGMIADSLIRAYGAGLAWSDRDLEALARMADFALTLEWTPGGFYHDENHAYKKSRMDCQNTTALAAVALTHIHDFLAAAGYRTNPAWLEAVERALPRLLAGQEPTGQWPYRLDELDKYPCDMNHHGMMMVHLGDLYRRFEQPELLDALRLGGEWIVEDCVLHTEHGSKHNWVFQKSACLYFTWGYFMTASALQQLAALDEAQANHWSHEARELLRYVRTDLWHNARYETEGPFKLTEGGWAPGYAWHGQSMGWCCYQMDHILCDLGYDWTAREPAAAR